MLVTLIPGYPEETGKNGIGTTNRGPSGAAVWSSPTVDPARGLLYAGTGQNLTHPVTETSDAILALDLMTGEVAWSAALPEDACRGKPGCFANNSAAVTVIDGVVFAGGLDGVIRAHSTMDGQVIWEFDTTRPVKTVGGVPGKGGAIDGPGPVVAGGMLFVSSGYGAFGQMPGNLLLAFGVGDPEGPRN